MTHVGLARRFGSGAAGLGALAVRIDCCTLPLLKKYALPIAKKVGRNLVSAAIPEIGQMIAGKKRLKAAAKDSTKKNQFQKQSKTPWSCLVQRRNDRAPRTRPAPGPTSPRRPFIRRRV